MVRLRLLLDMNSYSFILIWIISISQLHQALSVMKEYCQFEVFNATCPRGSVILMEAARYGRMNIGRCADTEVYIGCAADVVREMDSVCSGRTTCQVTIPDSNLHQHLPCPHDIMAYLEAGYTCIEENRGENLCSSRDESLLNSADRAPGIYLSGSGGFLTSHSGQQYRHGTPGCPWVISVPRGQTIDLIVMDFSLGVRYKDISGLGQGAGAAVTEYCHIYAVVREAGQMREFAVCTGKGREKSAYSSQTNSISIELPETFLTDKSVNFIIRYSAAGCADMDPPRNAWVVRQGDRIQVTCNHTSHTWHLVCRGTQWIGNIGEASECEPGPSTEKIRNGKTSFPTYGLIIAVVIGVVIGGLCGFSLLAVVLWCKRRADGPERPKRSDLELVAQCDSPCKLHQRLNTGQYGYTHVWEVTGQGPGLTDYQGSMYGTALSTGGGGVYQQQTILPVTGCQRLRKNHPYESPNVDDRTPYYCQGLVTGPPCPHGTLTRGDWRHGRGSLPSIQGVVPAQTCSPYSPVEENEDENEKCQLKMAQTGQGYRPVPTIQDEETVVKPFTENPYT